MRNLKHWILASGLMGLSGLAIGQAQIVTTIKPLHSLVSQITAGVSEPTLLVKQGSPHSYQLKPSDAKAIHEADLLVWVGDDMEVFVPDVIAKVGSQVEQLAWSELDGIERLKTREGGLWAQAHTDHGDDHEDETHHEEDEGDEHNGEHDHHHSEHDHHHGEYDQHLWLSTHNAAALLDAVAERLVQIDAANESIYKENLTQALKKLEKLDNDISMSVNGIKDKPYMVFHDAYQYFEHEYHLNSVGTVRVSPEHEPGAARIGELREIMQHNSVKCLFAEPQFPVKMAEKLIDNTQVKLGTLDPIGADIPAGVGAYETLMRGLVSSLHDCLDES